MRTKSVGLVMVEGQDQPPWLLEQTPQMLLAQMCAWMLVLALPLPHYAHVPIPVHASALLAQDHKRRLNLLQLDPP